MCISAGVVAGVTLLSGVVSTYTAVSSANANKAGARYEMQVRQKAARDAANMETLAAMERENARSAEFAKGRSAALAAIGAANIAEHISFMQGADPDQKALLARDIRNSQLNLTQTRVRLRDEIQVADMRYQVTKANANNQIIGAFASLAKTAMGAYSGYAGSSGSPGAGTPRGGGSAPAPTGFGPAAWLEQESLVGRSYGGW